jgi:hypothetical protein
MEAWPKFDSENCHEATTSWRTRRKERKRKRWKRWRWSGMFIKYNLEYH